MTENVTKLLLVLGLITVSLRSLSGVSAFTCAAVRASFATAVVCARPAADATFCAITVLL